MQLSEWLSQAHGRGAALAAHLKVPASFVSKMAGGEKSVPVPHMAAIERFTAGAVTRKEMRPGDWHRIWPELSDPNPAPAPVDQAQAAMNNEVTEGAASA